jgi:PAS domain S-box-containing protein
MTEGKENKLSLLEELAEIRLRLISPGKSGTERGEISPLSAFFFAMEGLSEMVVITDLYHKIVYVNAACLDLLGYHPEELMGRKAVEYFEGIPGNPSHLARKIAEEVSGGIWEGEIFNRRKDGELITVKLKLTPLADPRGKVIGYVGISEDITERTREKEALRMSEEMLRLVLANIPQAVFWKDLKSIYIGCNRAFADIVGLEDPGDIAGKTDYELSMTKDEADLYRKADKRVMESAVPEIRIKEQLRRSDGTEAWVETSKVPLYDAGGEIMGVLGTFEDITERQKAEEALRESEARNRAILNAQPDLMFLQSRDGTFLDCHAADSDLLYTRPEEFLGKKMSEIFPEEFTSVIMGLIGQVIATGQIKIYEYELSVAGQLRSFETRIVPCGEDKILSIIRDITERKLMEVELINARKLESLGTLAGGIAHDFNNILAAILGNVSFVRTFSDKDSELYNPLIEAEAACLRAQGLTKQLLTFSRGGKPVKAVIRIGEMLTDSTEFALHGSNVIFRFQIAEDLWPVAADRGQIDQVINNLAINADQAMANGGELQVRAENVELEKGEVPPLKAGRYVKVEVEDEGVGIPAEHLERVFDPYFTTKQKGSGLGLASAYSIVINHSGVIHALSEPGKGTTFVFFLPASNEEPKVEVEKEYVILGQGRVLLMDDEEIIRKMVAGIIKKLGYEAVTAIDGEEAIEKYREAMLAGNPFAGVILDLTIKGGMGGEETLHKLKAIDPEVKAIVSSGYSLDLVMSDYKRVGFAGMITKPYSISKMSQILGEVIGK